jgi:hypothetical protein
MLALHKGTKAMYEVLKLGRIQSSLNCQLDLFDKMVDIFLTLRKSYMWASNFLTVEVVYKILYEPFQLSLCYQVPIFHSHIIMWVLPFCQIGLVDNLSKTGFYQVSKPHT